MNKHYYSIEERLYLLTDKQVKELDNLFPRSSFEEQWDERLAWIEMTGKYIGQCHNLAY